ncbi:hypothetical protein ACJEBH_14170 [Pseudomonas guariconensis]|uniref:hypothetical protein n=1 Tax=Pseudomonas guariconensis TaxID=1288410 RepID=UPI0038729903
MNLCFAISDVDWSLTKDVFGLIGTAVSLVGVGAAIYFGSQGLSAWRKQLKGSSDHNLAMDALVELYKFRDAINGARQPVFLPNAFDFGVPSISLDEQVARYNVFSDALKAKHAAVLSAKARLEAAILGCEAAWGEVAIEPLTKLKKRYGELETAVKVLLINADPKMDDQTKNFYSGIYRANGNIAFQSTDKESSAFTDAFGEELTGMELYLKSKLSN